MSFKRYLENIDKPLPRIHKSGVGKSISDRLKLKDGSAISVTKVYVHRNYAHEVAPQEQIDKAYSRVKETHPSFEYNTVIIWVFNKEKRVVKIQFTNSPDFDTASEPMTGELVSYTFGDDSVSKTKIFKTIWHHKWQWVKSDYKGFDVERSKAWSQEWFNKLPKVAIGHKDSFEKQLDGAGVDKSLRY